MVIYKDEVEPKSLQGKYKNGAFDRWGMPFEGAETGVRPEIYRSDPN